MATQSSSLDIEEQRARLTRTSEEVGKLSAETLKLLAEADKFRGEVRFQPWSVFFQGVLAAAAIVGAGIAIAKLFLA